ncbi:hypothetical protein EBT31_17575, partial [bacterium]|nr:hypothetical protein [bacterium]
GNFELVPAFIFLFFLSFSCLIFLQKQFRSRNLSLKDFRTSYFSLMKGIGVINTLLLSSFYLVDGKIKDTLTGGILLRYDMYIEMFFRDLPLLLTTILFTTFLYIFIFLFALFITGVKKGDDGIMVKM